jgi:superfamily II DNA helicase RecQ
MIDYFAVAECRQQFVLAYFGEEDSQPCGHCDRCQAGGIGLAAPEEVDKVRAHIAQVVKNTDTLTAQEYVSMYPRTKRLKAIAIIQQIRDSGVDLPLAALEELDD